VAQGCLQVILYYPCIYSATACCINFTAASEPFREYTLIGLLTAFAVSLWPKDACKLSFITPVFTLQQLVALILQQPQSLLKNALVMLLTAFEVKYSRHACLPASITPVFALQQCVAVNAKSFSEYTL
jgi:hypothetical protein